MGTISAPLRRDMSVLVGKYLSFKLGEETYGLPILRVQEIIRVMKTIVVPMSPPFVLGVINLRGKVIPAISLRLKFKLGAIGQAERTCIIVTQVIQGEETSILGMEVDEVSEVINLHEDQMSDTPSMGASIDTSLIVGLGKVDDKVVMLLDLDKAFLFSLPRWNPPQAEEGFAVLPQ